MKMSINPSNQKLENRNVKQKKLLWKRLKAQGWLQIFALMGAVYMLIFNYIPMSGIIIAFRDFKPYMGVSGFFTAPWAGFKYFNQFLQDPNFWDILRNTLLLSILKLTFSFPLPIIFALTLNEIRNAKYKRVVQTVSYLPHFISWVVVAGLIFSFTNELNGIINQILLHFHIVESPVSFMTEKSWFYPVAIISDVWKEMGWWAIIFLAAITGVDPSLYESAVVDGAGRLRCIWHITLPSIRGTIVVVLILSLGNLLGGGLGGSNFEQSYLLGNSLNSEVSMVLQKYVVNMGLSMQRFSFATAVGLVQSIIGLTLVLSSNYISKKLSGMGLF